MATVRSPRRLYLIDEITIKNSAGTGTRPCIAKLKQAVAEFLGMVPLEYNDAIFDGVFDGSGTNAGAKFRKKIGGFKDAAYTLIAVESFLVSEIVYNRDTKVITRPETSFRSLTIGLPVGHTVNEVVDWIGNTSALDEIGYLVTPAGHKIPISS
jgi:hypothetical protein